ncbi:pyridine nucleotide-disulfide oxidoreductase [Hymenobacter qilianensis]|nr:pyridine nucleotide-disulfide oxidoreductase [Hymenobacter qilianensis]
MLAVQLAHASGNYPYDVHLVDPRPAPGQGLAYSAPRLEYLLNVRAGRISAFPDKPRHFVEWLREKGLPADEAEFCPRQTYGQYIQECVGQILGHAENGMQIQWHSQAAVAATIHKTDNTALVELTDGHVLRSDRVVLALGNFPPLGLAGAGLGGNFPPNYHPNPWTPGALAGIAPHDSVLLIGTGLTSVDVLMALHADGHQGPIMAVSRHGWWPTVHGPAQHAQYPSFYASDLAHLTNVGDVVRVVRQHIRAAQAAGYDWRDVLDSLRPDLGRIWSGWPLLEQERFLRHVASMWSVVRHRSPEQNVAVLEQLRSRGQLQTHLGRVRQIAPQGADLGVEVTHGSHRTHLAARHVIACTGPLLDYSRVQDPLVKSLREARYLLPDPLRLGIQTDEHGALLNADGLASSLFFTLGPSRRPAYFESTAVPELREQAAALAQHILSQL